MLSLTFTCTDENSFCDDDDDDDDDDDYYYWGWGGVG